jgi:hypothetical protein
MKGGDVWLSITIFLIFLLLFFFNIISVGIKNVKENWPEYRCNPTVMAFSKELGNIDPSENFTYCVQNMQADYMSIILKPVNYSLTLAGALASDLISSINAIRHMMDFLREALGGILSKIYDTFLNMIIEFQKSLISLDDMVNKIVGMMYTMMYVMEGVVHSMRSGWNGPPGKMLQALGCFDPNTKVRLLNDKIVKMKDLNLGDKLKNGSVVMATINYSNVDENGNYIQSIYKIPGGENDEDIFVTGEHFVWDGEKWNYSKNHPKAELANKKLKQFSCLCTSDNKIQIGDNLFWDYNDTEEMRNSI